MDVLPCIKLRMQPPAMELKPLDFLQTYVQVGVVVNQISLDTPF